jgi:hypothetical protein
MTDLSQNPVDGRFAEDLPAGPGAARPLVPGLLNIAIGPRMRFSQAKG